MIAEGEGALEWIEVVRVRCLFLLSSYLEMQFRGDVNLYLVMVLIIYG
jgi:hypothetical protein